MRTLLALYLKIHVFFINLRLSALGAPKKLFKGTCLESFWDPLEHLFKNQRLEGFRTYQNFHLKTWVWKALEATKNNYKHA